MELGEFLLARADRHDAETPKEEKAKAFPSGSNSIGGVKRRKKNNNGEPVHTTSTRLLRTEGKDGGHWTTNWTSKPLAPH